jgi:YggT family protein
MNRDQKDDVNLEHRQELRHDEEAFRLNQEEKRLQSARRSATFTWIINSIFWLAGALGILLGMRFLLRLLGANSQNEFARLINYLSAPFIAPFSTLFISPTLENGAYIFDVNILIAITAYALLFGLIISLVRFVFYQKL